MNESQLRRRLLEALAAASQTGGSIDLFELSARLGARPFRVLRGLVELRGHGLVHPHRPRLTLEGLAVAAACGALEPGAPAERRVPRTARTPQAA